MQYFQNVLQTIGNTPLIRLNKVVKDAPALALKKFHETGIFDEKEIYEYSMEGVGREFIPKNMDFDVIDHFEKVTDQAAALMARRLVREEGLWLGHSSGAAVQGLMQMKALLKPTDVVVILCHDHGSRYMGKIYNDDWMREKDFLETETDEDIIEKQIFYSEKATVSYQKPSNLIK